MVPCRNAINLPDSARQSDTPRRVRAPADSRQDSSRPGGAAEGVGSRSVATRLLGTCRIFSVCLHGRWSRAQARLNFATQLPDICRRRT